MKRLVLVTNVEQNFLHFMTRVTQNERTALHGIRERIWDKLPRGLAVVDISVKGGIK